MVVSLAFPGASTLRLEPDAALRLYEALWDAPEQVGSVTAAARIHHELASSRPARIVLTDPEATAVRAAIARLGR